MCLQRAVVLNQSHTPLFRFSVNTMKVFLGAGILTMPFGMKQVQSSHISPASVAHQRRRLVS